MLFTKLAILFFVGAQAAPVVDDRPLYARSDNATIGGATPLTIRSTECITCPQFQWKSVYARRRTVAGIDLMLCCEAPCATGIDCGPNGYLKDYVQLYKLMVDGKPRCHDLTFGGDPTDPRYFFPAVKPNSCDNGAVQCPDHPFACCVPK